MKRKRVFLKIICALLIVYILVCPFLFMENGIRSLHFREYAFPVVLLAGFLYALFKKDILGSIGENQAIDVYVINKNHEKCNIVDEDKSIIVNCIVEKSKTLSIDRNFKELYPQLLVCNGGKVIRILSGTNDLGELDIKINSKYFGVEGLKEEEKRMLIDVARKYKSEQL